NSPHVSVRPPGTTTASLSAKNSAFRRTMSPISIGRASGFRRPLRHAVDEQVVVLEEAVADAAVELEAAEQLPDPRLVALAAVAQRHGVRERLDARLEAAVVRRQHDVDLLREVQRRIAVRARDLHL